MIRESIVTTRNADRSVHIAPMGVHVIDEALVIAPFKPSATLENLLREPRACINYPDDVRVYAGCLTDRREWPVCAAERIDGVRLQDCLAHAEVEVLRIEDDELRPRFHCCVVHEASHAPFHGFNRAQGAVIELAILVSRLGRLPREKVEREIEYLQIAVDKTAGAREWEAWEWLMAKVDSWRAEFEETAP
jgi:hypothetical protein